MDSVQIVALKSKIFRDKNVINKGNGYVHPRTGHKGSKGEYRYRCTLSLTSALDRVGGQCLAPAALYPRERPGTHGIGGWVGPRVGLDGCGKSRPHWY